MNTWNWKNSGLTLHDFDQVAVMMEHLQDVEEFTRKDYDTFKENIYPGYLFGRSLDWMIDHDLIIKVREEEFTFEAEMNFWAVRDAQRKCADLIELLGVDEKAAYVILKEKRGIDLENETQTVHAKRYYYKVASMDTFEDMLADFLGFKDRQRVEKVRKALNQTGLVEEELRSVITELLF